MAELKITSVRPDSDIEIAKTRAAGWAWRCWPCDITQVGLDEADAGQRARAHEISHEHRMTILGGGE